jgi:hypothetical protein
MAARQAKRCGQATHKGGIWEYEAPPRHLEGHAVAALNVFPEGTDGDEEEPHGEAPEPEGDEEAYYLDY